MGEAQLHMEKEANLNEDEEYWGHYMVVEDPKLALKLPSLVSPYSDSILS